jgi:hypothetical protein
MPQNYRLAYVPLGDGSAIAESDKSVEGTMFPRTPFPGALGGRSPSRRLRCQVNILSPDKSCGRDAPTSEPQRIRGFIVDPIQLRLSAQTPGTIGYALSLILRLDPLHLSVQRAEHAHLHFPIAALLEIPPPWPIRKPPPSAPP